MSGYNEVVIDPAFGVDDNNTPITEEAVAQAAVDSANLDEKSNETETQPATHTANDVNVDTDIVQRQRKHISKIYDDDDDDDGINNSNNDNNNNNNIQYSDDDTGNTNTDGYRPDQDSNKNLTSRQMLEEKLDMLIKKPKIKRSRRDEDDLEQYQDEKILRLKDEMNIAAQLDIDTLNKRIENVENNALVAIQKVKLLPKVESILSKANLADTILDNNLLQSVRIWLEPLPDGSLPSFEIQKSLFAAISELPIKTEHLKESGLGRVMIFYTKSKRVEPQLARIAERLIAEWTRPIIGASDNYRDKRIESLEFDYEKLRRKNALKKRKKTDVIHDSPRKTDNNDKTSSTQSLYEQAAARRGRAAAPAQATTDYKYAPVSTVMATNSARTTGVGSTLNNSELYKRLNSRLNKKK